MQAPQIPPPLTLPPVVKCPGAPIKKEKNPNYVPIGYSVCKCLYSKDEYPDDDGYETPPPTIRTEPPKLVRKKQR